MFYYLVSHNLANKLVICCQHAFRLSCFKMTNRFFISFSRLMRLCRQIGATILLIPRLGNVLRPHDPKDLFIIINLFCLDSI